MIETAPSERKQWLFETDHLKAQGRLPISPCFRRIRLPWPAGGLPECGEPTALGNA